VGVIVGFLTIIAGVEVSYSGFVYTNITGLREISMMIYFLLEIIPSVFMLIKAMSKYNKKT
jgi:hypothetical protein